MPIAAFTAPTPTIFPKPLRRHISAPQPRPPLRRAPLRAATIKMSDPAPAPPETAASAHARLHHTAGTRLTHPLSFRRAQLLALRAHLHAAYDAHVGALRADLRKPTSEALLYDMLPVHADLSHLLTNLARLTRPRLASRELGAPVVLEKRPLGVVLVIGAFNFPVHLVLRPLIAAIAAGNCVVVKPSEHTPASERFLSGLAAVLDERIFACVCGGVEVSKQLLDLKWDHILFTGSSKVGKIVMAAAARHLTPVTLELGGKSPAVVTRSADIDTAAASVCRARFTNAGQFCLAVDYCLVEDAVFDKFKQAVVATVNKFYGDAKRSQAYGRLVSSAHLRHVAGILERSEGDVLCGGEVDDSDSHYIAPTVVQVSRGDSLLEQEIFGPVLPLLKIADVKEGVGYINQRDTPLALYIFCTDRGVTREMVSSTRSGSVGVNETVFQITGPGSFLGGCGESGMGGYGMERGIDTFSHLRPVLYSTPFFARLLGFMQPHRMIKDGDVDPRFERVLRLFGKMSPKGDKNSTPVNERFLGGVRTFCGMVVATIALLLKRKAKAKSE